MKSTHLPTGPLSTETALDSIKFGRGYYQLTHLNFENEEPVLRGILTGKQQRKQLSLLTQAKLNTQANPDYIAPALLLEAFFRVKENAKDLASLKVKLQQLAIPGEDQQIVPMKMGAGRSYVMLNLDEFREVIAASPLLRANGFK